MRITLGRKLYLAISGLLISVLLIVFAVLEYNQARQWHDYLEVQHVAFARFATPELLKHFRGDFGTASGPAHRQQLEGLLGFNPDLVKITIYSPTGRTLFDLPPLNGRELKNIPPVALTEAAEALDPVAQTISLDDGTRLLEVIAPAFGPGGSKVLNVRYLFSFQSVEERLAEMHKAFLLIAVVACGVALLLIALLARSFTRPIARLTSAVRAISRGELNTQIESRGHDELALLASAFNEMTTNLEQNQSALQAKNSELHQVNEELQQIQERMVRTERLAALGQVAAGVSHEIDNPVGIILGYAELLLEDCAGDDPRREDILAIIDECQRCRKITGGLLGLARLEAKRREQVDLEKLCRTTLESLQPQKLFQQILVHYKIASAVPKIIGDADRIRQILVNLFLNSAQAMQGAGQIWVELTAQDGSVFLLLHDDGPGIPEDKRETIFDPFFSTKDKNEGTGLGLSICRKLIEEQGGDIQAMPSVHGGACLRVRFPVTGEAK